MSLSFRGAGAGGGSGAVGTGSLGQAYGKSGGGGAVVWSFLPTNILPLYGELL